MNRHLLPALLFLFFAACKKNIAPQEPAFAGKNWQLVALQSAKEEKILPDDYGFNMHFEGSRIKGKGACNYLTLFYQWRFADSIYLFPGESTLIGCDSQRLAWDKLYAEAMVKVRAFNMPDSNRLELLCSNGDKIIYKKGVQDTLPGR
ncbi:MAG: META domain-containing protein [Chitinophagales bacterium]|nr:META domain-containing protein [Chitinophagales bacterium]